MAGTEHSIRVHTFIYTTHAMHTENTYLITASAPGSCCLPALTFSSSFLCFCSPRVGFLALLPRCHCLWERIENGDKKICWSRQGEGEGEERSLCELWFTCVVGRSEYVYCRPTQHSFTFHHFHALSYVPWCPELWAYIMLQPLRLLDISWTLFTQTCCCDWDTRAKAAWWRKDDSLLV